MIQDDDLRSDQPGRGLQDLRSFRVLLQFAKEYRAIISAALVLILTSAVCGVLSALVLGRLVQEAMVESKRDTALLLGGTIILLELSGVVSAYFGRLALSTAASHTILNIRKQLFARLNLLPMAFFDRQPLGRIVMRLTYDVEGLEDFFSGTLARVLSAVLTLIVVFTSMMLTNFKLGLILTLMVMPAVAVTFMIRGRIRFWNREFAIRNSTINSRLNEFLKGINVIRAFGAESWAKKTFDKLISHHLEAAIGVNILNSWSRPIVLLCCYFPLLYLLAYAGPQVLAGTMSVGMLVTFIRFTERFSRPISALAQEIHTMQTAFTNAERITTFLSHPTELEELGPDGALVVPRLKGEVEFKEVTMGYNPVHPVLSKVSFKIPAGTRVGLAGRTGSGKTTTLGLLARLYEFQQGDIFLDGESIRKYDRSQLRHQMGYVSQDTIIFRGTLRENLAFGETTSDTRILQACSRTGLAQVLAARNIGLDFELLDQGANLSHGERQMIALTRVLIKDPALLILDEATANIDPGYERLVVEAINSVMRGRTCLIIAHRLATLRDCDTILVFREGQLLEQGSHSELIAHEGYYSQLLRSSGPGLEVVESEA